jgi:hypothetical protein
LHDRIAHVPVLHVAVALASLHTVPQPPQFASVWMFVSQPLAELPSQSAKPALQLET